MNITGSWAIIRKWLVGHCFSWRTFESVSNSFVQTCTKKRLWGYKDVKKTIEKKVSEEVKELYRLGFRGADLLTACFGQAVSVFGKYERVEKADGSNVTVAELLKWQERVLLMLY